MQLTQEFLYEQYISKNQTQAQIAHNVGCSQAHISRLLKTHKIPSRPAAYHCDITNQKFNRLTAIKYERINNDCKRGVWVCNCDCGNITRVRRMALITNRIKSCGCLKKEKVGPNSYAWKGGQVIPACFFYRIKTQARVRAIPFDLTMEELEVVFNQQQRKCIFTGVTLYFDHQKTNASLDRINSSGNYTFCNIQFVQKCINTMKHIMNNQEFIDMCRTVVQYKDESR